MGVNYPSDEKLDLTDKSLNEGTLPAEKEKTETKSRRKKTEQQQIIEELKNIRRLLALPLRQYNVNNDKDAKFIERMNK